MGVFGVADVGLGRAVKEDWHHKTLAAQEHLLQKKAMPEERQRLSLGATRNNCPTSTERSNQLRRKKSTVDYKWMKWK